MPRSSRGYANYYTIQDTALDYSRLNLQNTKGMKHTKLDDYFRDISTEDLLSSFLNQWPFYINALSLLSKASGVLFVIT
jgi:hypothetical protein|tara:strand:- start:645 stop:881 length:237 start_codon:yes stop_codon:yes gene_type:complete